MDLTANLFNAKYWPHTAQISMYNVQQAQRWCYDNFRSRNWRSVGLYFAFKREADYLMFVLKWA